MRDLSKYLNKKIFQVTAEAASEMGRPVYVIGGWVRDLVMGRPSKDIDIVVAGNGPELASLIAEKLGRKDRLSIFKNFGTAMLTYRGWQVEFVGARKESYRSNSRKPVVEQASLEEDISRRDFTINAMALSINSADFGKLIDPYGGLADIDKKLIRTPLDPLVTYSDDPLRMMRAIRFSTQLDFDIEEASFEAIKQNSSRISIVSTERLMDEFNKIMLCENPGRGIKMLRSTGLLRHFFPELDALHGVEVVNGNAHKDNFFHTVQVLDKLSAKTDNLWLRWAALLHDIAKPLTKKFVEGTGWTFHGHEHKGSRMVEKIFRRLRLPSNEKMKYVQKLVLLHLRPIALTESGVSDSAVRRLLFEAGDDIDDLMMLCEADITSGNRAKVDRYLENFALVRQKLRETEENDRLRNWQPPVSGDDIMEAFAVPPCREVGIIKAAIREAILDGEIPNQRQEALKRMYQEGEKLGFRPANTNIS